MSGIGWQDAIVALMVAGALGFLVWRKVRARKSASACGACPGCAVSAAAPAPAPVSISKRTPACH